MKSNLEDKLVFARCIAVIGAVCSVFSIWNFSKMVDEATRLQNEVTRLRVKMVRQNGIPDTTGSDAADRNLWGSIPERGTVGTWTDTNGMVWKFQR